MGVDDVARNICHCQALPPPSLVSSSVPQTLALTLGSREAPSMSYTT